MTKTAATKKSTKKLEAVPETVTPPEEQEFNLTELLGEMTDFELVQVGLVVMALLHKRAEATSGPRQ